MSTINEVNRFWSAFTLPQAQTKFSSQLLIHRIESGIVRVSEDFRPNDHYWIDCKTLFGRITESFFSGYTRYHRTRDRKRREQLGATLNEALGLSSALPAVA